MQYASMASSIVNAPVKNEDEKGKLIRDLQVFFQELFINSVKI